MRYQLVAMQVTMLHLHLDLVSDFLLLPSNFYTRFLEAESYCFSDWDFIDFRLCLSDCVL